MRRRDDMSCDWPQRGRLRRRTCDRLVMLCWPRIAPQRGAAGRSENERGRCSRNYGACAVSGGDQTIQALPMIGVVQPCGAALGVPERGPSQHATEVGHAFDHIRARRPISQRSGLRAPMVVGWSATGVVRYEFLAGPADTVRKSIAPKFGRVLFRASVEHRRELSGHTPNQVQIGENMGRTLPNVGLDPGQCSPPNTSEIAQIRPNLGGAS